MCQARKPCVIASTFLGLLVIILVIVLPILLQNDGSSTPTHVSSRLHNALKTVPIVDGHNDLPYRLRLLVNNQLQRVNLNSDLRLDPVWGNCSGCYTDIPRLRQGMVGGQFWVAYVLCEAIDVVSETMQQIDVIKRFVKAYPAHFQLVDDAQGIEEAFRRGRIGSLIGVEGGHSINSSLAILRLYYDLGVRYLTLTHTCNTPWAVSSTADDKGLSTKGLTQFGKVVVREMNRLGMLVDLSHVAYQTMLDALNVSVAPVFFSHSSAWALCNHSRNVRDDVLRRVAKNDGVVMVNFFPGFIQCNSSVEASLQDVVDHINYIRKVAGINHVGIGADYDGVEEMPKGLEDVSKYPKLLDRLFNNKPNEPSWTDEDMKKLAGLNIIRVFKKVEKVRDELARKKMEPYEDLIEEMDS